MFQQFSDFTFSKFYFPDFNFHDFNFPDTIRTQNSTLWCTAPQTTIIFSKIVAT